MSRKAAPGTLIHCEYCGEDYSTTYKRCPFCGEKPSADAVISPAPRPRREDAEDDFIFEGQDLFDDVQDEEDEEDPSGHARGGKRLAQEEAAFGGSWPRIRIVTFICSLVIVAAALVIIFAYIYPKIHSPAAAGSPPVSEPVGDPSASLPTPSAQPSDSPEPSPSEPVFTGVAGTVTGVSNSLRVRSGPGTSYEVAGSLRGGDAVTVMSDAGGGWYAITFGEDAKSGFVKGEYLSFDASQLPGNTPVVPSTEPTPAPTPTPTPAPTPTPSFTPSPSGLAAGTRGYVTRVSNGLRVRSGPGTSYDVAGSLRSGAAITIVSDAGGGWYQISYGNGSKGYIQDTYITTTPPTTPSPTPAPTPTPAPGTGGLAAGTRGYVTGVSNSLRVRSGPGTSYDVAGSLRGGAAITIVANAGGGWYQISYGNGSKGYIQDDYISTSAPSTPAPSPTPEPGAGGLAAGTRGVVANASGGLRVRSGPGTSYNILASISNGASVTVVSNAGDGWYQITFSGPGGARTTGYIKGEYISVP